MKKTGILIAATALLILAGCGKIGKDDTAASEVGKWYAYNTPDSKEDVAFVLELKADKTADFMICAWGSRWQGTYTYDGKVVKLTWNKFLYRGNAGELGTDSTSPSHLYDWWKAASASDEIPQDPDQFGKTISIGFTYTGDSGVIDLANKPCTAQRQ